MNLVIALFFIIFTQLAYAESFDMRAQLGKEAESKEEYKAYQPAIFSQVGNQLANVMRFCFATIYKPDIRPFILVADINTEGKAESVEVQPRTNTAECFMTGFSGVSYPKPPIYSNRPGFPITMEMRITP